MKCKLLNLFPGSTRAFHVLLFLTLTGGTQMYAQSIQPLADAKVQSSTPTTNYPATALEVRNNFTESYLKFDLTSLQSPFQSVKLRLRVNYAEASIANTKFMLYYVPTDSWTETTLTWSNKPAPSGAGVDSVQPTTAVPYTVEFDITNLVNSELANDPTKILSLKVISTVGGANTGASFLPRENATVSNRPQIVAAQKPVVFSDNPAISSFVFGENIQLPKQIGNNSSTGGKMDKHYGDIQFSGVKSMRYGGVGFEKNVTDSSKSITDLINKVDSMRNKGIEPILTAPLYYTGNIHTIEDAASQARRIMHAVNVHYPGNPVTKWVISNEPDGGLHSYNTSSGPDSIRKYIATFSDSLRAEASASGYAVTLLGPELTYFRYIDQLTDKNASTYILDKIDVFTYHVYPFGDQGVQSGAIPDRNGLIKLLSLGAPTYTGGTTTPWENDLTYLKQRIAASNNPNVKVGITEANVCFYQDASGTNSTPGTDLSLGGTSACSFIGGQFWAEMMAVCMKNNINYLNFWSVIEGTSNDNYRSDIGYLSQATEKVKPSYHHFSMVANNFSGVYCYGQDTLTTNAGTRVDSACIKAFGSKDVNANRISVLLMNQSLTAGKNFTLHLGQNAPRGTDSLDVWIDADLPAKSYRDSLPPQATLLVVFDANGNEVSNCLYTIDDANAGRGPACVSAAIITPATLTVKSDSNICGAAHVVLTNPVAQDRYGIASYTNNAPAVFPVGTTTVIWTVTDVHGNIGTTTQLVTVVDSIVPIVTAPANQQFCYAASNNYQVPVLTASDNCGVASISYSITGATARTGTGGDASGQFNTGTSNIVWTVTDNNGNKAVDTCAVNVSAPLQVSIPDVYVNPAWDDKNTIYVGYGPTELTLKALSPVGSGSLSYLWTTGSSSDSINVNAAGNYAVTATDSMGCTASDSIEIFVVVDTTYPALTAPALITANTDPGAATASGILLGTSSATDKYGIKSVTNDAPATFPVGTTTVTWTATNNHDHTTTALQLVTVTDNQSPIVTAPVAQQFCNASTNIYHLPALTATDNCGIAGISYSISGATQRSDTTADASGSFNPGTSTIAWTVTDIHGNITTGTTNVVVDAALSVSVADVYALNAAVDAKNTLYIGYGPTSLNITAVAGGGASGYSYNWSNYQQGATISATTSGTYTVSVTDAMGCVANASIRIDTLDVRCGNNYNKVTICHNSRTICVAPESVQDHLNHGDALGSCNGNTAITSTTDKVAADINANTVVLYPNPTNDIINLKVGKLETSATVRIYNVSGALLINQRLSNSVQSISLKNLPAGVYYVQVTNGSQIISKKVVKQ